MTKYYKIALKLCRKSNHRRYKMAAVVVKGGAIVSAATNTFVWGRHAERRCLKHGVTGDVIIVAREGGRMSKPCENCLMAIKAAGIREIIYADWNQRLTKEIIGR